MDRVAGSIEIMAAPPSEKMDDLPPTQSEEIKEDKLEILIAPREKRAEIDTRNRHFELYKAALADDWPTAERIFRSHENDITAKLSKEGDTTLHIAAAASSANFVKKLVERMKEEHLAIKNNAGNTAFFLAAASGRVEIVKAMMEKNKELVEKKGENDMLPLQMAAMTGNKKMVELLYDATREELLNDSNRFELLVSLINHGLYDIAFDLVARHPAMATARDKNKETALYHLAKMPVWNPTMDFSGISVGKKLLIRLCKDLKREVTKGTRSVEDRNKLGLRDRMKIEQLKRDKMGWLGRISEAIQEVHLAGEMTPPFAAGLVECLCQKILLLEDSQISEILRPVLFEAAKRGSTNLVHTILRKHPKMMFEVDENHYSVFHFAVKYRHELVFRIIDLIGPLKDLIVRKTDDEGNNILHLAAKLPPRDTPITESAGAAFQMRREHLLFKAVEKLLHPADAEALNKDGKTARTLFTEQHKDLKDKAERWTKEIANACIVAATLIATVVFSAALTVPGGTKEETGTPHFVQRASFIIFAIADTSALLLSSLSIARFISVFSHPYEETDYAAGLYDDLSHGLEFLHYSVALMMVGFCANMFIVFKEGMLCIPILFTAMTALTFIKIWKNYFNMTEKCLRETLTIGSTGKYVSSDKYKTFLGMWMRV